MKPRVFVTREIPDNGLKILKSHCQVKVWPDRLPPTPEELRVEVTNVEGLLCLLTDEIDAELMAQAPHLKVISNYAVGYDNIDVAAAKSRGITITHTPGVLTDTTADFAFALLLAVARRVIEGDRATRSGEWLAWEPTFLLGKEVHRATLGIVGLGRIGRAVLRRAQGFGMRVLYHDRQRDYELEGKADLTYVSLSDLMQQSDFVSIHVPLTDATYHLLAQPEFEQMKQGAILINTSRGEVVDEDALVDALNKGRLGGAGLDVYSEEPLPLEHPLQGFDNVILAPHLGSATVRTRRAMAEIAANDLVSVLKGTAPCHPVKEGG